MKDKGNSMNLQKVSNKEKIETIISKCKNQDLKYTTDLYEKIVFLDYNKNNSINVYEEPTIQDLKFILTFRDIINYK